MASPLHVFQFSPPLVLPGVYFSASVALLYKDDYNHNVLYTGLLQLDASSILVVATPS